MRMRTQGIDVQVAGQMLGRTPATLRAMLGGLPGEGAAGGGDEADWGPFDVVGHLIFGEETDWIPRARIILEHGDSRPFVPFDRFAQFVKFEGRSMDELLGMFEKARAANVETLREMGITAEQLELRGMHPELGPVTMGQLLATWVVHDLDHISQVAEGMARPYDAEVGPWKAYLPILGRPR
jgi:hypothetical protein